MIIGGWVRISFFNSLMVLYLFEMWKSNCYERGLTEVKDVERTHQLCLMFERVVDKNRLEGSRGGGWTERVPNTGRKV